MLSSSWLIGTDGDWAIAVARIVLGIVFFAHGAQKTFGWFGGSGLRATLSSFEEHLKIPPALGLLAILTELLGGLGLLFGLLTRIAALGIAVVMCIAIFGVHRKFGFFMDWYGQKQGHGIEYHLLVLALALIVIVKGAGAFSLDQLLYQHISQPSSASREADTGRS